MSTTTPEPVQAPVEYRSAGDSDELRWYLDGATVLEGTFSANVWQQPGKVRLHAAVLGVTVLDPVTRLVSIDLATGNWQRDAAAGWWLVEVKAVGLDGRPHRWPSRVAGKLYLRPNGG